jgi:hypothetical protein
MSRINRFRHVLGVLLLLLVSVLLTDPADAAARNGSPDGRVELWFFWTDTCPHCLRAVPFVEQLSSQRPWLDVRSHRVTASAAELELFARKVAEVGGTVEGVPTFVFCETTMVGFGTAETTGAELAARLDRCHAERLGVGPELSDRTESIDLPLFGVLDARNLSLPMMTLVIAALDAFNPCAFFVLLFLLSLLVHSRSRLRMILIGGVFVAVSGLLYFAFMAAWLNLMLVFRGLGWITPLAGAVAVAAAILNIKDFFRPGRGPSLSIPETAKPGLFARMRRLVAAERLPVMLAGTITLAVVANSYELLCTSGFPLLYTRILTLDHQLPVATYYLYLALYNVIYVLPMAAIVAVFTWTLGSRKLSEREGRALKLVSGLMMLQLGLVLLIAPDLLSNVWIGLVVLIAAVVVTGVLVLAARCAPTGRKAR